MQTCEDTELEYYPCRYGESRTRFRGPRVKLKAPYTVVLGGSETFGKFVEDPFCDRLAEATGRRIVNLGVHNGGLDAFARDDALRPILAEAETTVIQLMGAANLSNRFYTVHARRNDRFLRHSILMETLFQDVDFADFAFTRHMLTTLMRISPDKFAMVARELEEAWTARMRLLLTRVPGRKLLLWIEDRRPAELGHSPLLVTPQMIERLAPLTDGLIRCDVTEDFADADRSEMIFPDREAAAAHALLPPVSHERVAVALSEALGAMRVEAA